MSRFNQFGYDVSSPNSPYHLRTVLNKCGECGHVWAGSVAYHCAPCSTRLASQEFLRSNCLIACH